LGPPKNTFLNLDSNKQTIINPAPQKVNLTSNIVSSSNNNNNQKSLNPVPKLEQAQKPTPKVEEKKSSACILF
jgi:hypothetical protein